MSERTGATTRPACLAAGSYLVQCSRVVWRYEHGFTGLQVLAVNAYVLVAVALLVLPPAGTRLPADREAPAPPALRPRQPLASTGRA